MQNKSCSARRRTIVVLGLLLGATTTGCVSTSPSRLRGSNPEPDGVVIGTLSVDGKSKTFEYVYAQAPRRDASSPRDVAESPKSTRVVLTTRALAADTLSQIFAGEWKGEPGAEGVVVDIGAESEWDAQFMTSDGLAKTYGITTTGGEAQREGDRARGRIALSNQSDAGVRVFRVSFNVAIRPPEPSSASKDSAASLVGGWRIEAWKDEDGRTYDGDLHVTRAGSTRLRGEARIRNQADDTRIEEMFDVIIDGNNVRMYGVVDPDVHWIADSLSLRFDGTALIGENRDEIGKVATIRLQKTR